MADTSTTPARAVAPEKTVDDLLNSFSLAEIEKVDPIENARKERVKFIEEAVAGFAKTIVDTAKDTDDNDALKGALVSLQTVRQRAIKAVRGLPAGAFGITATPAEADDSVAAE